MGLAPLGYVLYSQVMRHNPANPAWANRDRFVLSAPGHACMLQYSLPAPLAATTSRSTTSSSSASGGASARATPSTGSRRGSRSRPARSARASPTASASRSRRPTQAATSTVRASEIVDHHTFVICGDGDMEEGISSEAASLAGNLGLGKLIAIYDDNEISDRGLHPPRLPRQGRGPLRRPTAGRSTSSRSTSTLDEIRARPRGGARASPTVPRWSSCRPTSATAARTSRTPAPPTARRSARRRSS